MAETSNAYASSASSSSPADRNPQETVVVTTQQVGDASKGGSTIPPETANGFDHLANANGNSGSNRESTAEEKQDAQLRMESAAGLNQESLANPDLHMTTLSTTTFPRFPELPLELRLKIWRWSFPRGRRALLEWRTPAFYLGYVQDTSIPAVFSINFESRTEALKHYWFISREMCASTLLDSIHHTTRQILLLANPVLDDLIILAEDFNDSMTLREWLQYVEFQKNGFLEKIQRIELLHHTENLDANCLDCSNDQALLLLSQLREAEFVFCACGSEILPEELDMAKTMVLDAEDYFAKHSFQYFNKMIPKINLRWQLLQGWS